MASFSHFVELLLFIPIAFISLAPYTGFVYAQSPYKPVSTGDSASVFIEGKAFYIQGGTIQNITTNQTFYINLRTSWNITNPTYTPLPNGLYDKLFPNALLPDGATWFAISNNNIVTYNIPDGKITQRGPATMYNSFPGLSAVFDRTLDEIVIPNGASNGFLNTNWYIAPGNLSTRMNPVNPPSAISGFGRYSVAWSESAQKAFLFGGSATAPTTLSGNLYQRSSTAYGLWSPINTTLNGLPLSGPTPREAACMVPAFNGTKLILFGGSGISPSTTFNVALDDVYIYDVATNGWATGPNAGAGSARVAHACAVSGDVLIVWGGFSDLVVKKAPIVDIAVYNLTANKWVDRFISPNGEQATSISAPRPTTTAGSGPSLDTPSPSGSGNSNIGAVIGGVAAAIVILAALAFVLWRRGSLKKRSTFLNVHHRQGDDQKSNGGHNYKEPAEKFRDPHFDPSVQSHPQLVPRSVKRLRHPQLVMSQHERDFAAQMQLANDARHPQLDILQHEREYTAGMQPTNGTRHPQFDIPQHQGGQYQQNNEELYDYRDPFGYNGDPHGDLIAQPTPQAIPRPANGVRHPQLDVARRKQELAAEMQMLEMDSGEAPAFGRRSDGWSSNRTGRSPYPR